MGQRGEHAENIVLGRRKRWGKGERSKMTVRGGMRERMSRKWEMNEMADN